MKKNKYLLILFILLISLMFTNQVNAKEVTLEEVSEVFNNSELVEKYKDYGIEMEASINESESNILKITLTRDEVDTIINYKLDGFILSNSNLTDDNILTFYFLVDSIGKLYDYKYGDILYNFNMFDEEIKEYTINKEGFEIKENNNVYTGKVDISKKIPLIDESKFYLKPTDFDMIEEFVASNEYGNQSGSKGKFTYNVSLGEFESSIYIGENTELTESAYKSILSALEVMYGKKVVDYFMEIYPEFTEGMYYLDGFTIDTDEYIDIEENPMYEGRKVVSVIIDNEFIQEEVLRDEYIGEIVDRGNKTLNIDFTKDKSYKLGFFDSPLATDAGFLFRYILEEVFISSNGKLVDNTAYFNLSGI